MVNVPGETYPAVHEVHVLARAMMDALFLRLNERFALGADDLQWILYRASHYDRYDKFAPLAWCLVCSLDEGYLASLHA
jgi:hypothetical protein